MHISKQDSKAKGFQFRSPQHGGQHYYDDDYHDYDYDHHRCRYRCHYHQDCAYAYDYLYHYG